MKRSVVMNNLHLDALAFEYQRDYGTARSDFDVSDLLDNPNINSVTGILSLGFPEKILYFPLCEIGVLANDTTYSFLVT